MNLYDEGPFHVLLVPNITGSDFQRDNGILPLGGYDEGRQILKLAQWVQSPGFKYHKKISEVHLLGVSLGGSSTLYAALYASHNRKADGSAYINSAFVGCPVVDLEKSVQELYSGGIISQIFKRVFWHQMQAIANDVPVVREIIGDGDITKKHDLVEIEELITRGALSYYKKATLRPDFNLAPFQDAKISNRDDLWNLNRFQNYADQVNLPVYVWAADNDKIVSAYKNADLLKGRDHYNLIRTPKGNHCMFSDSYSWKIMGAITRGIFVSKSRHLYSQLKTRILPLNMNSGAPPNETENWFAADAKRKHRGVQWQAVANSDKINLIAYGIKSCLEDQGERELSKRRCVKGSSIRRFSYASVGISDDDRPQDDIEAQALTRWLNSNVWVWGAELGRLRADEAPSQIEVRLYGQRHVY
jgi:pimeloyl-ACP methyl ester carboxylesterase